ncbi:MAG: hypothetical protein P4K86_10205 [Terracidiphilus sp.]|nr:hypothetical protein [Terracidiphilus sp.]
MLILAGLLTLNWRSHEVRRFLQKNSPLLLFFFYCAISILWSDYPLVAVKRYVKSVGDIVMVLVVLTDPAPLAATKRLFTRVSFILLPLSVLLILFYPNLGTVYIPSDRLTMYIGVTTFKNELGMTCMVCGLSSLWSLLDVYDKRSMPHRARHLLAHGILLLTAVGLIVKADAMTSLSCLALAGAVMVIISQRLIASGARTVHAVVGGAIWLAVFALFVDSAGTLVQSLGRKQNLTGRTWIWQVVLSLHTNPLIGTGFQSFWMGSRLQKVWDMTAVGIQEAHNGYLDLYLNLGWIGLIFLGGLMVTGYRDALGAFSRNPHAGSLRLAFFTAALIFSLTEAGFGMMSPIWIAFLLTVTIIPQSLRATDQQRSAEMPLTPIVIPRPSRLLR